MRGLKLSLLQLLLAARAAEAAALAEGGLELVHVVWPWVTAEVGAWAVSQDALQPLHLVAARHGSRVEAAICRATAARRARSTPKPTGAVRA